MRQRLIEGALLVFARHGASGTVIEQVITHAEVSRGTFYNYFRTNEELLEAVAEEVSNQMLQIVDPLVSTQDDPAARVACGVRLTLMVARAHPHVAAFLGRVGAPALGARSLAIDYVSRDLANGVASGRFTHLHPRLAFDLVTGPVLAAFHTLLREEVPKSYPQQMAQAVLQSLGMTRASAHKVARMPLPALVLPQESLLVRAEMRAAQLGKAARLGTSTTAGREPSSGRRTLSTASSSSRSGAPRGTSGSSSRPR